MDQLSQTLTNYFALVAQVDTHIQNLNTKYPDEILCRAGCDSCCRFLSLFPVEAFALAQAYDQASPMQQARILDAVEANPEDREGAQCPLLFEGRCLLYKARPLICRTHGYPLYIQKDGEAQVDFCPQNFQGIWNLPKESLLDLDQLNLTLLAVNKLFLEQVETDPPLPQRIPVSQAVLLLTEDSLE
ncbi:MAG: YkgJ family cysteine cluster protein [Desulfobacterales bacterium]|nr:YkgJ family cysteine cluster protein [Desulfobacterales bacterium]